MFVDVDGVLNGNGQPDDADCFWPEGHESAMRDNYLVLSRLRLDRFARMVTAHDLDIVLSTSWRLDATARAALLAAFSAVGIGARVLGDTPDLSQSSEGLYPGGVRGDEIRAWLEQLVGRRPAWVAIDDMPMATAEAEAHRPTPLMPGHLVCTDGGVGLSEADAERAGALLAEQRSAEG